MSFEEAYKEYLEFAKKRQKKESFNNTTHVFKARILPYFKDFNLYEISKKEILKWQEDIYQLNFSNNYNRIMYYELVNFLDYCVNFLDFPNNYLRELGKFEKHYEDGKSDFYTLKEFKKFIRCVDNLVYKRFFEFMFYCGTRPGEAMALQFKDLYNGYIHINKTITSHNGREFDYPKTKSSIREVKIDKKLNKDLLRLKKMYVGCTDDYFIFGGPKPLAPTTINRYKKNACQKANIRPITLHQFRHSHATLLVTKGILINEVSRRLGHSNVSTTLNVYTNTDLTQEKKVEKPL